jgi:hypothetical protein
VEGSCEHGNEPSGSLTASQDGLNSMSECTSITQINDMHFKLSLEHTTYIKETLGNSHILLFAGLMDRSHIWMILLPETLTESFLVFPCQMLRLLSSPKLQLRASHAPISSKLSHLL